MIKAIAIFLLNLSCISFGSQKDIIGKWIIGSIEDNDLTIACNICPQIEFFSNQQAAITFPSNEIEKYTWSVSGSKMTLLNKNQASSQPYFSGPDFTMTFEEKTDYLKLSLTNSNGTIYNLGKSH